MLDLIFAMLMSLPEAPADPTRGKFGAIWARSCGCAACLWWASHVSLFAM